MIAPSLPRARGGSNNWRFANTIKQKDVCTKALEMFQHLATHYSFLPEFPPADCSQSLTFNWALLSDSTVVFLELQVMLSWCNLTVFQVFASYSKLTWRQGGGCSPQCVLSILGSGGLDRWDLGSTFSLIIPNQQWPHKMSPSPLRVPVRLQLMMWL